MTATSPPKLTIVIPTYNSIEDLPGSLESIQDILEDLLGKEVFVLIQDGQSTDGTVDYVRNLNKAGFTLISEMDDGIYDAMNKAIIRLNTDWVYFLGSDDRLLPDFSTMLDQLTKTDTIYYANVIFSSDGKKYDGAFSLPKLAFRNICHQSMFFPSQILKKELYSLEYPIKSDWALNIRLFACVPFQYVDLDVATYNDTGGTSSTFEDSAFEKDKGTLFCQSHGYWMKVLCLLVPTITKIFHFATGRKKKKMMAL